MIKDVNFRKNLPYLIALGAVIVIGMVIKFTRNYSGGDVILSTESGSEIVTENTTDISLIETSAEEVQDTTVTTLMLYVYICGAVNNPGVYEVDDGLILNDIVLMAGGFSEKAAKNHINLVRPISENISVYIPTEYEVNNQIYSSEVILGESNNDSGPAATDGSISQENSRVNINSADKAQLISVPGIGEVTAQAIIDYRNTNGPFGCVEDLMKIEGIGQGKFDKFKEYICV